MRQPGTNEIRAAGRRAAKIALAVCAVVLAILIAGEAWL